MPENLFDKQGSHRYKVWLAAKEPSGLERPGGPPAGPNASRPLSKVNKLSDMETMLLLYSYGRPMDLSVESKCVLPNGQSADCKTTKVSSESVDFVFNSLLPDVPAPPRPAMPVGSPVSLDLKEVGAFKGILTGQNEAGFRVAVNKDSRGMIGAKLAKIAVEKGIGVDATSPLKAGAARLEPTNKNCAFTDHKGSLRQGMIVNLSRFDALLRVAATIIPPLGTRIVFRGPEWHGAEVTSAFEIGFVVKFSVPIPVEKFTPALRFCDV